MRAILLTIPFAILVFATTRCDEKDDSNQATVGAAAASTSNKSAAHAPAGVTPGSHEDWCGGHEVPESLCSRCNPKLIPAFKATGDWCEEHARPESQCLICHPDLKIERPPRPQG